MYPTQAPQPIPAQQPAMTPIPQAGYGNYVPQSGPSGYIPQQVNYTVQPQVSYAPQQVSGGVPQIPTATSENESEIPQVPLEKEKTAHEKKTHKKDHKKSLKTKTHNKNHKKKKHGSKTGEPQQAQAPGAGKHGKIKHDMNGAKTTHKKKMHKTKKHHKKMEHQATAPDSSTKASAAPDQQAIPQETDTSSSASEIPTA